MTKRERQDLRQLLIAHLPERTIAEQCRKLHRLIVVDARLRRLSESCTVASLSPENVTFVVDTATKAR